MSDISFSVPAYSKIILHAAKYPHCAVNGLLLAKESSGKNLYFVDAVPLFHICLSLSPMAEVALMQVDLWAANKGLVVAGYYHANENLKDVSMDKPVQRIADKIAEYYPAACSVIVDNQELSLGMEDLALLVYQHSDGKWRSKSKASISVEDDGQGITAALLSRHAYDRLIDFDNHFDDIFKDWSNAQLNAEIQELVQRDKE